MALSDRITFGMSLPHRSPDPISMSTVHAVAQRADALGFQDLWVTENTVDDAYSFDPMVILTYAAAVTVRIRVGVAVLVLPLTTGIGSLAFLALPTLVSGSFLNTADNAFRTSSLISAPQVGAV